MITMYCIAFYRVGWDQDDGTKGYVKGYSLSSKEIGAQYLRALGFKEDWNGVFTNPNFEYYAKIEQEGWCNDFPISIEQLREELDFKSAIRDD